MDLRSMDAVATDAERAAIDALLGDVSPPSRDALRHLLLPVLHAIQDAIGWISPGALNHACARLSVPPAEAYGVATFYALLSTTEQSQRVAYVCDDIVCRTRGAERLLGDASVKRSPCLGMCDDAPAAFVRRAGVGDMSIGGATVERVRDALEGTSAASGNIQTSVFRAAGPVSVLRRVGVADPASLDDYRAHGGYEVLRAAVAMRPERVIEEITVAKLLGRGGAAFPAGAKWKAVAEQPAMPHYVVCNADESEPGTFKDRVLLEGDPFAVIEAMTIAGLATGARRGYLYVRGEYPLAAVRLGDAIARARGAGLLGDDVMGSGISFDVELRRGAGAYIAGEETALFESIEGRRPEPRNKPPFPVTHGLFGKPTAINNVETLVAVLEVLRVGGEAFARTGTDGSTGTRLFCVSGSVERPGVYEVEFGETLRALLARAGTPSPRAVLLGGAAGSFVTDLDLRLTFEDARAAGVSLGSGVVVAFDDAADFGDIVARIAAFFREESCGQCVPCRVGTVRQEEALARLRAGTDTRALLDDIARVMRDASICGLGATASSAVRSALDLGLMNR